MLGSKRDDLKLAVALLDGSRRARKTFRRRFSDAAEIALAHAPRAVEIGLGLDEYLDGVAASAARSLLSAVPSSADDETLDRHVQRVLGHRDFALALLLRRGVPAAWRELEARFGDYLRSTFIRTGHRAEVADRRVEDVIARLRGGPDARRPAIADYMGRSDLRVWLFVFVRTQVEGRWRREFAPPDLAVEPFVDDEGELGEAVRVSREVFAELEADDRRVLHEVAHGRGPAGLSAMFAEERVRPPSAAVVARRHREIVGLLHHRIVDRFARERGSDPASSAQRVSDVVLEDAARRLAPVYGGESPR